MSVSRNQRVTFPAGTVLEPGTRFTVRSGLGATTGPRALVWAHANIWHRQGDAEDLRKVAVIRKAA